MKDESTQYYYFLPQLQQSLVLFNNNEEIYASETAWVSVLSHKLTNIEIDGAKK